ncbi:MAG: hypothetical protein OEW88_11375 [Gammaproteobacteria bacterium]|nr:hypothetical protein [Gammaproteobacteria bacterium]
MQRRIAMWLIAALLINALAVPAHAAVVAEHPADAVAEACPQHADGTQEHPADNRDCPCCECGTTNTSSHGQCGLSVVDDGPALRAVRHERGESSPVFAWWYFSLYARGPPVIPTS